MQTLGSNQSQIGFLGSIRYFSSHDDHLSRQDVVDRVLDVVKSFPKVDPAKVSSIFIKSTLIYLNIQIQFRTKSFFCL